MSNRGNRFNRSTELSAFGQRLAKALERSSFKTKGEFAKAIGLSRATLYHYDIGRCSPTLEVVGRMAKELRVKLSVLTG